MKTLPEYFKQAKQEKWALGHFNFSTADQLRAIVEVAAEMKSPVMVATSEGEDAFLGHEQTVALVKSWQAAGYPIFLNADHHKTWESVKGAMDAGYDTVLIDASKLPYEENLILTTKVVQYAKNKDHTMMVEGELGYLMGESSVQKRVDIKPEDYTKPEEAKDFVRKTGVERLAIAFGNAHGIITEQEEHLDLELLKKIVKAVPNTYLVLHGGSGLPPEEVRQAIALGITNVHINTELRLAYQEALRKKLMDDPDQTTPYKFLGPSFEAAKNLVRQKLDLFGAVGRI
ncbi:MAG: class II fructose-bisphosphate aldolase [bacterium]|nr:class II fructose-bisphosphate aldolase [bacterium]